MKVKGKGFQHCVKYDFEPRKVCLPGGEVNSWQKAGVSHRSYPWPNQYCTADRGLPAIKPNMSVLFGFKVKRVLCLFEKGVFLQS